MIQYLKIVQETLCQHVNKLAVDGWSLRCNWINPPVGPPKSILGGKYKPRPVYTKMALAMVNSHGTLVADYEHNIWTKLYDDYSRP